MSRTYPYYKPIPQLRNELLQSPRSTLPSLPPPQTKDIRGIIGYEDIYAITKTGEIWNLRKHKWMAKRLNPQGYWRINLSQNGHTKTFTIHRLVAKTFIPNPGNMPIVNHLDGNKLNNSIENLEWTTSRGDILHSWKIGLCKIRNGSPILKQSQVYLIRELYKTGLYTFKELAHKFNTSSCTIHDTINYKRWKWF